MFHKWQIIIIELNNDKYDYNDYISDNNEYDNELEISQSENNTNLYIRNLKKKLNII